jgi:hypothetical protein
LLIKRWNLLEPFLSNEPGTNNPAEVTAATQKKMFEHFGYTGVNANAKKQLEPSVPLCRKPLRLNDSYNNAEARFPVSFPVV